MLQFPIAQAVLTDLCKHLITVVAKPHEEVVGTEVATTVMLVAVVVVMAAPKVVETAAEDGLG